MLSLQSSFCSEGLGRRKEGRKQRRGPKSETLRLWAKGDARAVDHLIQTKNNRMKVLVDHISESQEDRRSSSKRSVVILSISKGKQGVRESLCHCDIRRTNASSQEGQVWPRESTAARNVKMLNRSASEKSSKLKEFNVDTIASRGSSRPQIRTIPATLQLKA